MVAARTFMRRFKKADGSYVMGQLGNTLQDHNVRTFILPRRFFITSMKAIIEPGEIIYDMDRKYLLLDHSEKARDQSRVFKMCEVNRTVEWKTTISQKDLVTDLDREDQLVNNGQIDVAWEFIEPIYDSEKRKNMSFRVLTGYPIQAGDLLDGNAVHYSEKIQGIYYGESS